MNISSFIDIIFQGSIRTEFPVYIMILGSWKLKFPLLNPKLNTCFMVFTM